MIAIDGFDARIFEELSASGRLPALTATLHDTRVRLEPRPGDAGDPARVWTTVATGQPPDVHGVQGLETRRVAGVQGSVAIARPSPLGRAIRGATDLVRLTRPAIASGTRAPREDVLGGGGRSGPPHGGRQLVGDLARPA